MTDENRLAVQTDPAASRLLGACLKGWHLVLGGLAVCCISCKTSEPVKPVYALPKGYTPYLLQGGEAGRLIVAVPAKFREAPPHGSADAHFVSSSGSTITVAFLEKGSEFHRDFDAREFAAADPANKIYIDKETKAFWAHIVGNTSNIVWKMSSFAKRPKKHHALGFWSRPPATATVQIESDSNTGGMVKEILKSIYMGDASEDLVKAQDLVGQPLTLVKLGG